MDRRGFIGTVVALAVTPTTTKVEGFRCYSEFNYSEIYMSREAMEDIRNWNINSLELGRKPPYYEAAGRR